MDAAYAERLKVFREDALRALRSPAGEKRIDAKYLYDDARPEMFTKLTHLTSYYPTNADVRTLTHNMNDIVQSLPDKAVVCEIGGNSRGRTVPLVQACVDAGKMSVFFQIDICDPTQSTALDEIRTEVTMPAGFSLDLKGLCADTDSLDFGKVGLPKPDVAFIFGGTALNCKPKDIPARLRNWAGRFGNTLIFTAGIVVDDALFSNAYNEADAVHVEWSVGLLDRMNRELQGDFNLEPTETRADPRDLYKYWGYEVEIFAELPWRYLSMYLVSKVEQTVHVEGETFTFQKGERIHIADTCRIEPKNMPAVLATAGLVVKHAWVDPEGQSALYAISPKD